MFKQYKYKFYLNANHSILINGHQGRVHPHTWEIVLNMAQIKEDFKEISLIEKPIEKILETYQDKYLNDEFPFNKINPTLENMCEYFKDIFEKELISYDYILLSIEMAETPTRAYIITLIN